MSRKRLNTYLVPDEVLEWLSKTAEKAAAYDSTHRDGWLDRAHAVAQARAEKHRAVDWGRDVWHICVEVAEEHLGIERAGSERTKTP